MNAATIRTVVLRVAALALLLLLALVATISVRTLNRLPDTTIYLVRSEPTQFTLERVHRRLDAGGADAAVAAAVAALAEGPTAQEADDGLTTVVPAGTEVRSVAREGGRLVVDLTRPFLSGGGTASMIGRLEQLRWTLTQPSGVEALELHVEGSPLEVLGGEGVLVAQPWRRPEGGTLPTW